MAIERDYEPVYVPAGERIFIPMRGGPNENDKVLWDPVVAEPCDNGSNGYWYCDTCKKSAEHNLAIQSHAEQGHRIVWICFEHGPETVHPQ